MMVVELELELVRQERGVEDLCDDYNYNGDDFSHFLEGSKVEVVFSSNTQINSGATQPD